MNNGVRKITDSDGFVITDCECRDGKPNGRSRHWDKNTGILVVLCNFQDGKKHGLYESWWPDGVRQERSYYEKGKRIGICTLYTPTGEVWKQFDFGK